MTEQTGMAVSIQELGPIIAQTVNAGGTVELTATGHSMLPLLLDRVSRVKLTAIREPKYGDVVLYRRDNGTYVLHRIVKCCADGTYTMCGDAQTALEPKLRRDQMIAVVQSFARRRRWRDCRAVTYQLWWRIHVADRPFRHLWKRGISFLKRISARISSLNRAERL